MNPIGITYSAIISLTGCSPGSLEIHSYDSLPLSSTVRWCVIVAPRSLLATLEVSLVGNFLRDMVTTTMASFVEEAKVKVPQLCFNADRSCWCVGEKEIINVKEEGKEEKGEKGNGGVELGATYDLTLKLDVSKAFCLDDIIPHPAKNSILPLQSWVEELELHEKIPSQLDCLLVVPYTMESQLLTRNRVAATKPRHPLMVTLISLLKEVGFKVGLRAKYGA